MANWMAYEQLRYAALGVVSIGFSLACAGWIAYAATQQQVALAEETQRLLAENAQAATAAVRARGAADPAPSPAP